MRISTSQIFDAGVRNLLNGQGALYKTQNQLGTGLRILTAEDDPVGASQVLLDTQSRNVVELHAKNQKTASSRLALEEDVLKSVVEAIQYVREKSVAAQNSTYTDTERAFFAQDIESRMEALLALANTRDSDGHYICSGFQGDVQAFQKQTSGAIQYMGDDGQRVLQVDSSREIAVGDTGRNVFVNNRTGDGMFAFSVPTTTNAVFSLPVFDSATWTGNKYQLQFTTATNYTITDTIAGTTTGPFTYTDGATINGIPGISFSITGTPVAGETFDIDLSANRSMFDTLQSLVEAFNTPTSGGAVSAENVRNTVIANMAHLEKILDNVARVEASIGTRMHELNDLSEISQDLVLHFDEKISDTRDLDYTEAISRFTRQMTQLEAAQKSFSLVTNLNLFNYI